MNRYLEKIAEIQKEAMRVEDLANIAKKVGLRREGDWRGFARQFADHTGALRPAAERAAIREKITGISNNAAQKMIGAQKRLRDTDEVLGFISEKSKKLVPLNTSLSRPSGLIDNPGMGAMNPAGHQRDIGERQARAVHHGSELLPILMSNKGTHSMVHTHPSTNRFMERITSTKSVGENYKAGLYDSTGMEDFFVRRNLPASSMGGANFAQLQRKGSPLRNKRDAHTVAKEFPTVDTARLSNPGSDEFYDELSRVQSKVKPVLEKLSPNMRERMNQQVMGDVSTLPMVNRRNSIIGMDNTIGVHTQATIPTGRTDIAPNLPYSYQHAYFDVNQGGHRAVRRMLKKGINPEQHGLDTSFTR